MRAHRNGREREDKREIGRDTDRQSDRQSETDSDQSDTGRLSQAE